MKLETLIHEPTYDLVLNELLNSSQQYGHKFIQPTPLISPFWNTTFTPSSSEVIFRELENEPPTNSKIYTIQPCIRINDLPHLTNGYHCLFFHMFTSFVLQVENFEDTLNTALHSLAKVTRLSLPNFYITVSTNPHLPNSSLEEGLGDSLLQKIGIPERNIIFNSGSDNYQNRPPHKTADHKIMSMTGPKIEIYVQPSHEESLYEVATCILATAQQDKSILGNVFAIAVGLERASAIAEGKTDINQMHRHTTLNMQLSLSLLHPSMAETSMGRQVIAKVLLIMDALAVISPIVSVGKRNPDLMTHYRRVVRELARTLKAAGITLDSLFKELSDSLGEDIEKSVNNDFLRSQMEENYLEYI
jgi:alanyl-tRNA synthetase